MSTNQRRIDKYILQQRLGYGGMAEVWKAYDPQLQRYVAIKILHADLQADPEFLERFIREARVIASLYHPNIVQLHDFQISQTAEPNNTIAYMVMEYIEGPTLAEYMDQKSHAGKFPPTSDILSLFASISRAIDYAHSQGMIHRDIKPANILLDKRRTEQNPPGEPILTDFGIARLLGKSTSAMSATWLGTALYISPEQVKGYPGNERSDLYALGVILYEMCTGVCPFQAETPAAIMRLHINNLPTPPALINPHIPPALSMVILRSLAKDPGARFSSAAMMSAALAEALNLPIPENLNLTVHPTEISNEPTQIAPQWPLLSAESVPSPGTEVSQGSYLQEASLPGTNPAISPILPVALATPQTNIPPRGQASTPMTPFGPNTVLPGSTPASGGTVARAGAGPTPIIYSLPGSTPSAGGATVSAPAYSPPAGTREILTPVPAGRKRRRGVLIGLVSLLILLLAGSGLSALYLLTRTAPAPVKVNSIAGHVFFVSSGQLYDKSAQGINDELEINLQNIPAPAAGKNYYAWLLGDIHPAANQQPVAPILLGKLIVKNGISHLLYSDPQHMNLLGRTSRFLITEESGTPLSPSTNQTTWHYFAEIPQKPEATRQHFSVLDYIRHILFEGVSLPKQGIHGGLDSRTLRNMQKVWEWASSAKGSWRADSAFIHRQLIRILEAMASQTLLNTYVSPKAPILVEPAIYQLRLFDSLLRIDEQLRMMLLDPTVTPAISRVAKQSLTDLVNIRKWLNGVLSDVKQLLKMTNAQLQQPAALTLLDDLETQSGYAFTGKIDPVTGTVLNGYVQMHYTLQQIATFDVLTFTHTSHW